jgi:muramoyltetrapeptide carboxypeptidase
VVWAIRGGRGSSSIFAEGIDQFRNFVKAPKLFIGFSDITAIHLYINTVLGWPSLHWGYLKEGREKIIFDEIAALLKGEIKELHYKLTPVNASAKQVKIIDDTYIIGGNASLIQRSIGTDTMPDTKDKILFMEDVEEAPTRINELFTHFDRAGLFKKPKAIILGDFISDLDETDKEGYRILEEMFAKQMDQRSIPVFHSGEFGHILTNKPLFLNTPTKIIQQVSGVPTLINATNNW